MMAFEDTYNQVILVYTPEQLAPSWIGGDARRFVIDAVSRRARVSGVPATHDGNGAVDE